MDEERVEVFRGHLDECLAHLGKAFDSKIPRGTKGASKAKKPIAEFCGVGIKTVTRWVYETERLPVGAELFKLMYYLDMIGYRIIELERLEKGRRFFGELIGFGIFDIDEAAQLIGYANSSSLSQLLQGNTGTGEDKDQKMWGVWKEMREALEEKKKLAREHYFIDLSLSPTPPQGKTGPETPDGSEMPGERRVLIHASHPRKRALFSIMEGLSQMLEEEDLVGNDAQLKNLEESADIVLRLSSRMNSLTSRLIVSIQQKKG